MKTMLRCAAVLALAAARAWAAPDKAALIDHLRESYNFPASVGVSIGEFKPSEVEGFEEAELTLENRGGRQSERLFVSKDGRHYLLGGFKDLRANADQERLKKVDLSNAPVRGARKTPVLMVEYTDFQCPFCERGYRIARDRILKEYPGKVRWVYKSMPLKAIHPWAESAAVAAECAALQDEARFWRLHDALFDRQKEITYGNVDQKVKDFAQAAGLDQKKFAACYEGRETRARVERSMAEAAELDINGTPAFLVNGHLISGADYDSIKRVIDESLKGKHGKL